MKRSRSVLAWWSRRRAAHHATEQSARRLYAAIVAQARSPFFFAHWGVPDTNDGRFEMIGLHTALVVRRLRRLPPGGPALAQALVDLMFADMDRSLREIGVGDLSVGKWVKRMAGTFLARTRTLDEALGKGDRQTLVAMLERNFGVSTHSGGLAADRLADYLVAQDEALIQTPEGRMISGQVAFIDPRVSGLDAGGSTVDHSRPSA